MSVELAAAYRHQFAADLRRHRAQFSITDIEYTEKILGISLNTFKKCLAAERGQTLALQRNTFHKIFENAKLDPKAYGMATAVPQRSPRYGGYDPADFEYLTGRFLMYRRSFLTAQNITRGVIDIFPGETGECLSFHEVQHYRSDAGVDDETHHEGDIYFNPTRNMLGFLTFHEGELRSIVAHLPPKQDAVQRGGKIKIRGALLTVGIPKGFAQPTVSAVLIEGPAGKPKAQPIDLCGLLTPSSPEFAVLSGELEYTEDHMTVMTPLMFRKGRTGA